MALGERNSGSHEQDDFSEINITPFVDVVLVLLVIFMVTAPAIVAQQLKVFDDINKSLG